MKTSTIKLSFYDNINRYLKKYASEIVDTEKAGKRLIIHQRETTATKIIANFHEFYIDGQKLINLIGEKYWNGNGSNSEHFFDNSVGWLGVFSPMDDFIIANHILLRSPSRKTIQTFYESVGFYTNSKRIDMDFESLSDTTQPKAVQIYGCVCGDEMCGGLEVQISKNDKFYFWDFGDDKLKLQFEKEQYEHVFEPFLSF